jgi:hypothetical protein
VPTLSISVSSSTVASRTRSYTIPDADLQSVIDWGKVSFASSLSTAPTNNQIMLRGCKAGSLARRWRSINSRQTRRLGGDSQRTISNERQQTP